MLLALWAACRRGALARPDVLRPVPAAASGAEDSCATWARSGCASASAALLFRTVQLFFLKDVQTGLVWFTKIITDPFHDVKLYCKAPLYLLRGELIEPERTGTLRA